MGKRCRIDEPDDDKDVELDVEDLLEKPAIRTEIKDGDDKGLGGTFKTKRVRTGQKPTRSVLYYMKGYETGVSLTPVQLPPTTKICQV